MRAAKAQAILRICAESPEPLLITDETITKISCSVLEERERERERERELVALLLLSYGCLVTVNVL